MYRKNKRFYFAARRAAEFERAMNFFAAAEFWREASLLCSRRDNIEWCVCRAGFCEMYSKRISTGKQKPTFC